MTVAVDLGRKATKQTNHSMFIYDVSFTKSLEPRASGDVKPKKEQPDIKSEPGTLYIYTLNQTSRYECTLENYFLYFSSKHMLWVLKRTVSMTHV